MYFQGGGGIFDLANKTIIKQLNQKLLSVIVKPVLIIVSLQIEPKLIDGLPSFRSLPG